MTIKTIQKFQAADGTEFNTREEAVAHNRYTPRVAAVNDCETLDLSSFSDDERGSQVLYLGDLAKFLAKNGDLIIELLTPEPVKRAPRTPKAPAAA